MSYDIACRIHYCPRNKQINAGDLFGRIATIVHQLGYDDRQNNAQKMGYL